MFKPHTVHRGCTCVFCLQQFQSSKRIVDENDARRPHSQQQWEAHWAPQVLEEGERGAESVEAAAQAGQAAQGAAASQRGRITGGKGNQ